MNERDSEALAAQLATQGFSLAPSEAVADVVLLNTCSVRDMAEQKALHKMAAVAADLRPAKPNAILGFLGCMAQSRGAQLLEQVPGVRLVLGTQKLHHTAEHLNQLLSGDASQVVDVAEENGSERAIREHLSGSASRKTVTAFISIMQGCNQHCTFCIVPFTRGAERSRPIPEIVEEIRALVEGGVKEVTLLGQIVTSYGRRDLPVMDGRSPFVQLLDAVHAIDGLERIRFTSPHPKGYGDDLVEAYGRLPKLVESAHIPVQSGSDRILKQMHRGYTRERFLEIISKLRKQQPGMGISTDFIVGFPGETEADFEDTLALAREVQFDQAYIFKYSERRDTPAAGLPAQLPTEVKEERNMRLLETVNNLAAQRYNSLIGKVVEILVEGPSKKNPLRYSGRTRCNRIVVFDGSERHRGQLMKMEIIRAGSFTLYGNPDILS
jgi:tRNA-2-methylthio-N6-dimethylallyladenosine synthase